MVGNGAQMSINKFDYLKVYMVGNGAQMPNQDRF